MRRVFSELFATAFLALAGIGGCTLVTDAGSYEEDATAFVRDLDYSFDFRSRGSDGKPEPFPTHSNAPLDVAVVNQDNLLRARARIILSAAGGDDYQIEHLVMENALLPGETYRLFFFVDSLVENGVVGNYQVDGTANQISEHVWIEEPAADGTGSFIHSTDFNFFTENDYRSNTDLALLLPKFAEGRLGMKQIACMARVLGKVFEIRVRAADGRVVGLFRRYQGTILSKEEIRINGVIDAEASYELEVNIDGTRTVVPFTAADETTLALNDNTTELPFTRWFPDVVRSCGL